MLYKHKLTAAIMAVISCASIGDVVAEQSGPLMEEVAVTGIRRSLQAASDLKRDSAVIQDSIVAEDIGKFPDQNVAESLQRISGVSISRTNGEGSKITVRGFGPSFNVVRVNDRTLATTEAGREFDFQVLASELIAGADVVKAPMAKTPEGSMGAYVNVKTARPLDNPGLHVAGSVNAKYSELSGETSPEVSGVISNTFADETIGVLLGYSRQESSNRIDAAATSRWAPLNANQAGVISGDIVDTSGNVVTPSVLWYPGRYEFTLDEEERERTGINAAVQWSPDESWVNTFDFTYTDFSRVAVSQGMQVGLQFPGWRDVVASENGTALAATKFGQQPHDGLFQVRGSESKTKAFGFNTIKFLDRLTLEFDASHSTSEADPRQDTLVPNYVNNSRDPNLFPNGLDPDNDFFSYDMTQGDVLDLDSTIDYADPANVRAHWNQITHQELKDEITEFKFDGGYQLDLAFSDAVNLNSVEFGVAVSDREKTRNVFATPHVDNCGIGDGRTQICGAFRDMDDAVFSTNSGSGFLGEESGNFPRDFIVVNSVDQYHAAIAAMSGVSDWPNEQFDETRSTTTSEETRSVYGQLNFSGVLGDNDWSGNLGLRYVETDTQSTGFGKERISIEPGIDTSNQAIIDVTYTEPGQLKKSHSYDNVLPSLNLSYNLTENLLLRAAAAKVISRPAIEDIGVNKNYVDVQAVNFRTSGGNPFLNPYEATQFDLSLEYYHDSGSAYAINLFRKDIDTFISTETFRDETPNVVVNGESVDMSYELPGFGSIVETITQKGNRSGGQITGVELSALHYFDYLPGFWSGFGVQANYTWAESEDKNADPVGLDGVAEPGSGLEGFANNSYNLIAFYDKEGFQARLAYNWRDDFLQFRTGARSGGLPEHVAAYGQLDFSMSYDINENFTLSAEAINLTDERTFEYVDVEERLSLLQYAGPRFKVGLRMSF
ncbi:TonB-dependent receptor [Pseudomaricurvus alcaniphilus]|uniref:TonB-dependent receptor n=1 Tax=Pseudomaricurvus alcaniphilus TaxID=1166482 RepID=UPI001407BFB1|nr:TonB-dependent receptor [Pseudomaricurvus alcaniphilus]NHN39791.1 TonB-dependent receptor [Pseudomaricurvus alcaniphilus]